MKTKLRTVLFIVCMTCGWLSYALKGTWYCWAAVVVAWVCTGLLIGLALLQVNNGNR